MGYHNAKVWRPRVHAIRVVVDCRRSSLVARRSRSGLESIIARTIRQVEETRKHVRVVGLSATLPNYDDVAAFARVDHGKGCSSLITHTDVPIAIAIHRHQVKKPLQRFQLMNEVCYEKVDEQAGQTQVMVFVTREKKRTKRRKLCATWQ